MQDASQVSTYQAASYFEPTIYSVHVMKCGFYFVRLSSSFLVKILLDLLVIEKLTLLCYDFDFDRV